MNVRSQFAVKHPLFFFLPINQNGLRKHKSSPSFQFCSSGGSWNLPKMSEKATDEKEKQL